MNKNVIVTSVRLSAIGWFTGVLSEIHKAIYQKPIMWNYEISKFECTRERRALPIGWNTVWNASPRILAKRGFDKVLVVQRPINDFLNACCWYDHGIGFGALPIEENARYLSSLVRIYDKLYTDVPVELPNVYHVFIENLNKATLQEFKSICSFLEFDMDKFPVIIPIKVKRDWEVYGGYNKSLELDLHLQKVKKARENDKNEC